MHRSAKAFQRCVRRHHIGATRALSGALHFRRGRFTIQWQNHYPTDNFVALNVITMVQCPGDANLHLRAKPSPTGATIVSLTYGREYELIVRTFYDPWRRRKHQLAAGNNNSAAVGSGTASLARELPLPAVLPNLARQAA